jgi:hypothetical protein
MVKFIFAKQQARRKNSEFMRIDALLHECAGNLKSVRKK